MTLQLVQIILYFWNFSKKTSSSAFDVLSLQKIGCTSTIQVNLIVFGLHNLCNIKTDKRYFEADKR